MRICPFAIVGGMDVAKWVVKQLEKYKLSKKTRKLHFSTVEMAFFLLYDSRK